MAGVQERSAMPAVESPTQGDTVGRSVRAPRNRGVWGGWRLLVIRVCVFALLLALWQLADRRWLPDYLISSPAEIATELGRLLSGSRPGLWSNISVTAQELVLGYVVGVVGGVLTGLILGYWPLGAAIFGPLITAINGIPKIALAPLFLIWFGIGIDSKVAIAAMTVFFVMFYNTYMGVTTMPKDLSNAVRIMGGGRGTVVRKVVLPQISVPLLAGLKASVPFAMIGVIVGEFIASDKGVGYFISNATQNFDSASVFSGIVILMAMIIVGMTLVGALERRILRWQHD